jgi:hypothetical protein
MAGGFSLSALRRWWLLACADAADAMQGVWSLDVGDGGHDLPGHVQAAGGLVPGHVLVGEPRRRFSIENSMTMAMHVTSGWRRHRRRISIICGRAGDTGREGLLPKDAAGEGNHWLGLTRNAGLGTYESTRCIRAISKG